MIKTAEFVSPKHPDKICDLIADSILDAYLARDPRSRAGVEVMGGHGLITINGEVTSRASPDIKKIARGIVGPKYKVISNLARQSPEIARGVDTGGAGDQGVMNGYATAETPSRMPLEYELARDLCRAIYKIYPYDGKTQITLEGKKIKAAVASFQNTSKAKLLALVKKFIKAEEYFINPAGDWKQGGFDADTGLSGRKIIIDNYGPEIAVGGGSFSGKDPTKVDRSGAYMARRIAVDYLKKYRAREVKVKLAYAIGRAEPIMAVAWADGRLRAITDYDLTPQGIIKFLKLRRPIYARTAVWGHFGRGFIWG